MRAWAARLRGGVLAATSPAALATVRTGVGTVMLLAPQVLPALLGVDAAARARTSWAVQMVGVREVALGAGLLVARRSGSAGPWLLAGSVCDVVDALAIGAAVRRAAVDRPVGTAIALSAVAAGLVAAARR